MVRKNKGKKKKGGGGRTTAPKLNDDSSLIRIRNVWPDLDEIGRWTCTNCRSLNSMITGQEPGGCYDCGHSELDEKFAVLIIPLLVQLHNAGLVHRINLRIRSTWKLGVVQEAQEVLYASHLDYDVYIDFQFQQLHRLIKVRSLIYEEDSGSDEPERLALAERMITDCQNDEYMKEIAKTTEFHTLVDCIQHYQNQKSKAVSSISSENNNNEVSRTTDDEKLGSNTEENMDQQSGIKSLHDHTDMDTRLVTQYITHLLEELQEVIRSLLSPVSPKRMRSLLGVLESDDITLNPRTVIRAQLQFVQFTDDHRLDNRFSLLREFVNVRSVLKSDGIEMAAAKLEEASHKQHMKAISQEPFFQKLLSDMKRLASVNNSNKSNTDSLKSNTKDMDMETENPYPLALIKVGTVMMISIIVER